MRRFCIRWAVILGRLHGCRERCEDANLALQAQLILLVPAMTEAFLAYAAGHGTSVVLGILYARAMKAAQQVISGIVLGTQCREVRFLTSDGGWR